MLSKMHKNSDTRNIHFTSKHNISPSLNVNISQNGGDNEQNY